MFTLVWLLFKSQKYDYFLKLQVSQLDITLSTNQINSDPIRLQQSYTRTWEAKRSCSESKRTCRPSQSQAALKDKPQKIKRYFKTLSAGSLVLTFIFNILLLKEKYLGLQGQLTCTQCTSIKIICKKWNGICTLLIKQKFKTNKETKNKDDPLCVLRSLKDVKNVKKQFNQEYYQVVETEPALILGELHGEERSIIK